MRMPKTLLIAAGLLLAGSAVAEARPATVTRDLNVRSGPGTGYRVLTTLPAGGRVDVGSCSGSWCRVAGGYASASYLAFGGGSRVVVTPGYNAALGVGAFALGVGVGSAWDNGYWWGPGWRGGGYWGPGWGRPGWRNPAYWRNGPGWGDGPRADRWRDANWRNGQGWRDGPRADRARTAYNRNGPGFGDGPRVQQFRQNYGNFQQFQQQRPNRNIGAYRAAGGNRPIYRPMGGGGGFRGR